MIHWVWLLVLGIGALFVAYRWVQMSGSSGSTGTSNATDDGSSKSADQGTYAGTAVNNPNPQTTGTTIVRKPAPEATNIGAGPSMYTAPPPVKPVHKPVAANPAPGVKDPPFSLQFHPGVKIR